MTCLDGLEWKSAWISHLGCHLGCVDYLGLNLSRAWVYGGTGHAFAINIHETLCPSGPTAWRSDIIDRLAVNLGYIAEGVTGHKSYRDFAAKQRIAWALATGCIDTAVPCYGWELHRPEWYVITGYDDVGYYYSGPGAEHGRQPLPWQELGTTEIGRLSVKCVLQCTPSPDEVAVVEALTFALDHSLGRYCFNNYVSGPQAFEVWADALESGRADRFGAGYNGECWRECREMAVEFLREARERLSGRADDLFAEAIEHYEAVHAALKAVVERIPFEAETEGQTVQDVEAAQLLREAGATEQRALNILRRLRDAL